MIAFAVFIFSPAGSKEHGFARLALKAVAVGAFGFVAWYVKAQSLESSSGQINPDAEFKVHLEITPDSMQDKAVALGLTYAQVSSGFLALGAQAYTARFKLISTESPPTVASTGARIQVQLLSPDIALPSMPIGTLTKVLIDGGTPWLGRVVKLTE